MTQSTNCAYAHPSLDRLESWADADEGQPVRDDILTDLRSAVAETIARADYDRLKALNRRITPLATALSRRLMAEGIPSWAFQAAEIPVLAALVRGTIHYLDWIDPVSALQHIRNGEAILEILAAKIGDGPHDQRRYVSVQLGDIRGEIQRRPGTTGDAPSTSTISRALTGLEEASLIHLTGATRQRKFRLMPKAWKWLEEQRGERDAPETEPSTELSEADSLVSETVTTADAMVGQTVSVTASKVTDTTAPPPRERPVERERKEAKRPVGTLSCADFCEGVRAA